MKGSRRFWFLAIAALLVTSLVACAGPASPATPTPAATATTIATLEPTPTTVATPAPTATSAATPIPVATPTPAALTVDALKNAAYQGIYEGQIVQLTGGKYEGKPFVEGGASRPTVTFTGDPAFGDLNGDGMADAVVVLVEDSGGSGRFLFLAVVINRNGSPENVTTQFLGDRVRVESIAITGSEITIALIAHGPDDPMCCPSQKSTVKYRLEGNQLVALRGLEGTVWGLLSYGDPANPKTALPNREVTIVFNGTEGRVNGSAGCNQYFGDLKVEGQKLAISTVGSTKMACVDEGVMNQEQAYLAALEAAERYEIEGDRLRIFYAGGQVLTFAAVERAGTESGSAAVTITEPAENAVVDVGQAVTIRGTGRGLFEGNVVVQVLDKDGKVLAEQATILQGDNVGLGGAGTWEVSLRLGAPPGTQGVIRAFSTSPADGSVTAEARVAVTFGASR